MPQTLNETRNVQSKIQRIRDAADTINKTIQGEAMKKKKSKSPLRTISEEQADEILGQLRKGSVGEKWTQDELDQAKQWAMWWVSVSGY